MRSIVLILLTTYVTIVHAKSFDHRHITWNTLLKQNVIQIKNTTAVDYIRIKQDPSLLNSYLNSIQSITPDEFKSFTSKQQLALLINAYNAYTIKLVVDNYPIKSIKDIGGIFSSPWKKDFLYILDEKRNLDYIEHELIRKNYNEPRIHFAVVCASIGCPSLRNEAYIDIELDNQLEDASKNFLQDKTRNYYDSKNKSLYLSSIFKWYKSDFEKNSMTIQKFVSSRITSNSTIQKEIVINNPKIEFLDYDWNLNIKK